MNTIKIDYKPTYGSVPNWFLCWGRSCTNLSF